MRRQQRAAGRTHAPARQRQDARRRTAQLLRVSERGLLLQADWTAGAISFGGRRLWWIGRSVDRSTGWLAAWLIDDSGDGDDGGSGGGGGGAADSEGGVPYAASREGDFLPGREVRM